MEKEYSLSYYSFANGMPKLIDKRFKATDDELIRFCNSLKSQPHRVVIVDLYEY
jgi:hypothetical protein